jgi:hypothetical protein
VLNALARCRTKSLLKISRCGDQSGGALQSWHPAASTDLNLDPASDDLPTGIRTFGPRIVTFIDVDLLLVSPVCRCKVYLSLVRAYQICAVFPCYSSRSTHLRLAAPTLLAKSTPNKILTVLPLNPSLLLTTLLIREDVEFVLPDGWQISMRSRVSLAFLNFTRSFGSCRVVLSVGTFHYPCRYGRGQQSTLT